MKPLTSRPTIFTALTLFCGFLAGCSGPPKPAPEVVNLARQMVADLGNLKVSGVIETAEHRYERAPGKDFYHEVHGRLSGTLTILISGKESTSPLDQDADWEGTEGEYSRMSVGKDTGGFFIVENERINLGGVDFSKMGGTYRAVVEEGSWEGYQAGQPMTLKLTEEGIASVQETMKAYFHESLSRLFTQLLMAESKMDPTNPLYLEVLNYVQGHAKIHSTGKVSGLESNRYVVESDTLHTTGRNLQVEMVLTIDLEE